MARFVLTFTSVTPPTLALVADDLELDPPVYSFDSTAAGTLRWDFHSSATPPAAGAGDIATGTQEAVAGQNDISLDLSAHANVTGYLHFRIDGSNILTSQEITVPDGFADYTPVSAVSPINVSENGATQSDTNLSPLELGYFRGATIASAGATWQTSTSPTSSLPSATSGVPIACSVLVKAGTSGNARIDLQITGGGASSITGTLGSLSATASSSGTISDLSQADLGNNNWRIDFTITPSRSNTYFFGVGPFSAVNGETIIWLGYKAT